MHREHDHGPPAGGGGGSTPPGDPADRGLWIGIGGPVGVGKTALVAAICEQLRDQARLGVVTNDIFTTEDADYLKSRGVLPPERIVAVETGACPHSAVRDDISVNVEAAEQLARDLRSRDGRPLDLLLIESGGDNLTMTFSHGLVDAWIFVLDVAGGDDVPRKGGPGVTAADLLVINKTDLGEYVGADPARMLKDAQDRRAGRPTVVNSLRHDPSATPVVSWIRDRLAARRPAVPGLP
ncbi:urease accessory protein UreG [Spongiactinospora rosea]|uniref:Urease accessory protein UreG n=1 Tax=Spongiactinospora rosea TaxID=2248750 RepID=A0A366M161_9ACTN|nr:urease accessory protein UreG [Spongiactinospora rosea]RBQ19162.1 urease accessory protein UreG [Spongiactinospora rosea]